MELDALKIVCLHYDTKTIEKSISNNKKYELFNDKVINMCVRELIDIYSISNIKKSREYKITEGLIKQWTDSEWKFIEGIRNKYKTTLTDLDDDLLKKRNFKYVVIGIKLMEHFYNLCDENYVKKECIKNDINYSRQNLKTIQEILIDNVFQKILDLDF